MSEASLPYAGTSGFSGTETSEARAHDRDTTGKTRQVQQHVMTSIILSGLGGRTIKEIRYDHPDEHHGNLSGALTALHKDGRIARLTETRDRCKVYVMPEMVAGRDTEAAGRRTQPSITLTDEETTSLARVLAAIESADHIGTSMISVPVTALKGVASAIERHQ